MDITTATEPTPIPAPAADAEAKSAESAPETVEPTMGIADPAAYFAARRAALSLAEDITLCRETDARITVVTIPMTEKKKLLTPDATDLIIPSRSTEETRESENIRITEGKRSSVLIFPTTVRAIFIFIICTPAVPTAPPAAIIPPAIGISPEKKDERDDRASATESTRGKRLEKMRTDDIRESEERACS